MARSCEQALAIGLPAVAFTEHLEFTEGGEGDAIAGVATDAALAPGSLLLLGLACLALHQAGGGA